MEGTEHLKDDVNLASNDIVNDGPLVGQLLGVGGQGEVREVRPL